MGVINVRDCKFYIVDGTSPTPNKVEIDLLDGQFEYTERYNYTPIRKRNRLDAFRRDAEEAMSVNFTIFFQFMSAMDGDPPTFREMLLKEGEASAWVSTNSDVCAPYCVDLIIEQDVTCTDIEDETITFPRFHVTELPVNVGEGQIRVSGLCLAEKPIFARADLA